MVGRGAINRFYCNAFFGLVVFLTGSIAYGAPIYVIEEADGTTRFTTTAPKSGEARVFTSKSATFSVFSVGPSKTQLFRTQYSAAIKLASRRYNVEEALIRAVIHAESGFQPFAKSKRGALGLMQLMPEVAEELGVGNPFDPSRNIDGGVRYLSSLLTRFGYQLDLALAAYNAGPAAVERVGGIPPYAETQQYVPKIKRLLARYRAVR